jgi:hypothetical protein
MNDDERLDHMIQLARLTGISLDEIVEAFQFLDDSALLAVSESPSTLPKYIQSSVSP